MCEDGCVQAIRITNVGRLTEKIQSFVHAGQHAAVNDRQTSAAILLREGFCKPRYRVRKSQSQDKGRTAVTVSTRQVLYSSQ